MESEVGVIIGDSGSSNEEDDEVADFLLSPPGKLNTKECKISKKTRSTHTN